MADSHDPTKLAVETCTPEQCMTCPVPVHTKAMCQAILAWKQAIHAIREQRTPESAAVVVEELQAFYLLCLTHGINAGLLVFDGNLRGLLAHMGEMVGKLAAHTNPEGMKREVLKLLVDLFGKPGAGARADAPPDKPIVH